MKNKTHAIVKEGAMVLSAGILEETRGGLNRNLQGSKVIMKKFGREMA